MARATKKEKEQQPIYVGIDPGKKGAIVAITAELEIVLVADMPLLDDEVDPIALHKILTSLPCITHCTLEHPQAIWGKSNKTAMVHLGGSYGIAKACVLLAGCKSLDTPLPSVWKRKLGATKDKAKSLALAKSLCPAIKDHLLKNKRCRVESDDRAEACLLAVYGLKNNLSKP